MIINNETYFDRRFTCCRFRHSGASRWLLFFSFFFGKRGAVAGRENKNMKGHDEKSKKKPIARGRHVGTPWWSWPLYRANIYCICFLPCRVRPTGRAKGKKNKSEMNKFHTASFFLSLSLSLSSLFLFFFSSISFSYFFFFFFFHRLLLLMAVALSFVDSFIYSPRRVHLEESGCSADAAASAKVIGSWLEEDPTRTTTAATTTRITTTTVIVIVANRFSISIRRNESDAVLWVDSPMIRS